MSRSIACPSRAAFDLVKEVERFPEFMSNVVSVRIRTADAHRKVAEWETRLDDAPLEWVEEGIYDDAGLTVRFRALEGVFDRFDGFWKVEPHEAGSHVTLELTYEIGLPEIEEIVGPILKARLVENAEEMLSAIERRLGQR
ncbi:MAG: type II toxin-antitoxin system RatA family toxin [Vicinamibacterales bacterium]